MASGYFAPYIDATGLHLPTYNAILADNLLQYKNIYGASVYLGIDSSDYQRISVESLKQSDTCNALQYVYNSRSILTAVGTALDSIVKPITRKPASFSTAPVTLTGSANTPVNFGQAQDQSGNVWALPTALVIGPGGTVQTIATAVVSGPISAATGAINIIQQGGTAGWTGITNTAAATLGAVLETDSALRARAIASLALPSQTRLAGTTAAIASLPGVTRLNCVENFTGATDANGNPAHSITCVVEGGVQLQIATAIYNNKTIGCLTNGTISTSVQDPVTGVLANISYDTPTYVQIYVSLVINAFTGYSSTVKAAIQTAIVNYLNSLQIGANVTYSALYGAALSVMSQFNASLTNPLFSITTLHSGTSPSPSGTSDIVLTFNEVSQGITANVVITP